MTYRNMGQLKDNFLDYHLLYHVILISWSMSKGYIQSLVGLISINRVLNVKEPERVLIKPRLSQSSILKSQRYFKKIINSIKSITKLLFLSVVKHHSTDILSDYAMYELDFQCLWLGLDLGMTGIFRPFSMVSPFFIPFSLHGFAPTHRVQTHTLTPLVRPIWLNLLYLTNLKFLGLSCPAP